MANKVLLKKSLGKISENTNDNKEAIKRIACIIGSVCMGGVEGVVFNYYRTLSENNIQFDFIIDQESPCEIPKDIKAFGCEIYKIPSCSHLFSYLRELKKILSSYQVVHSHMNALSVFSLLAAKKAGVPIRIAHSHSTAGKGDFKRNAIKLMLRPFSRIYPTHLLACSEYAGRWLFGDKAFDAGTVSIIRNAIDTSRFCFNPQVRERVRKTLKIENKLVVGHVGRFMTQKNHFFLLDIFKEFHLNQEHESVLLLIGDGNNMPSVVEKANKLGIAEYVFFLGIREDVHELYQAMDVFVLPSLYEGLPLVGVEAQCVGLPCVFSNRITQEIISGQLSELLPLEAGVKEWARVILRQSRLNGRAKESEMCCAKWDIKNERDNLLNVYKTDASIL